MQRGTSIRPLRWMAMSMRSLLAMLVIALPTVFSGLGSVRAQEGDLGFSPASGHARVVAQGVAALPEGEAVWRTVRTRALLPGETGFEERPLGFVLATSGPLLLANETGEQIHLGLGEAAFVSSGTRQQRISLGSSPVSYLSIELVPVDAAPPADSAVVLQPGQPFAAPSGLHDLDLLIDTLQGDEALAIPDSGNKNAILITEGTANVGRPGNEPVALLAGEAASFSGELNVAASPDAGATTFVVAMIGPELPPLAGVTAETPPKVTPEPVATEPASGLGSIALQVYTCPPGMTLESLNAAACAPAGGDFDVTISGSVLSGPLTIGDATATADAYVWSELPLGEYRILEAVLPNGYGTYSLAAPNASGNSAAGYAITIDESQPDLAVRIYNFTGE